MQKKFICIRCPQGCEVITTVDGYGNITGITGNSCKLGADYVKMEMTDPRRTMTTTVKVEGGMHPLVPVWTEKPVPKNKISELADALRKVTLKAPVVINQVVLENAAGTGINVIASRDINKNG
jgi:CxxC motif-containing protein